MSETPKNKGGRPRVESPKTNAQRQADHQQALKEAGGARATVYLTPESKQAVDVLQNAHGYKDRNETINTTLVKAASRVKR